MQSGDSAAIFFGRGGVASDGGSRKSTRGCWRKGDRSKI